MLKQLLVSNYALIDQVEIELSTGLTIITGETGAGKSILMGALGLILGERADVSALRDKSKKCIIEAHFEVGAYALNDFFERNELDFEAISVLRREIAPEGKSRAFINDTPVNLGLLKELSEHLIDIHSQHQTRLLNSADFQLSILDNYAAHTGLLGNYKEMFKRYSKLKTQIKLLEERQSNALLNQSFLQFQNDELVAASLVDEEELVEIEKQLRQLNNAETIKIALQTCSDLLQNNEVNVNANLQAAKGLLQKNAQFDETVSDLAKRIESVLLECKDIANEAESHNQKLEFDQEHLLRLSERSDLLNKLLLKHRCNTITDLIAIREDVSQQLEGFSHDESELTNARTALLAMDLALNTLAQELNDKRKEIAPLVAEEVNRQLKYLGMPHAQLDIQLNELDQFKSTGKNEVLFLVRTNLGTSFHNLDKVASGGELSRIMLCLKAVNAQRATLPTIIFDEIDTGVSGDIASKMGELLKQLGKRMQVISISHLPQIAGKGQHHFKVSKQVVGNTTYSTISELSQEARLQEIAGMISGNSISEAALANARILLED